MPGKILLSLLLFNFYSAFAQPMRLSALFPSAGKVDQGLATSNNILVAGCATGDCKNGAGRYVTVHFSDQGRYKDVSYGSLVYTLYDGQFNAADSSFQGQCFELFHPVSMKKGKSAYSPDQAKPDFSKARLIASGSYKLTRIVKNTISAEIYVRHGWVSNYKWEQKKYFEFFQSFTGYYINNRVRFARIIYPDNYSLDIKSFTGIVSRKGKPVLGIQTQRNGQVGNFGLYSKGIPELDRALFDTSLLLKLVKQSDGQQSIRITIPDDVNDYFLTDQDNAKLKTYTIENGTLIQPNGSTTGTGYTGPGIFYHPAGKLYAGGFSKGQPDGNGIFFIDEESGDPVLKKYEHKLLGTFSNGHVTDAIYGVTDSGTEPNFRRLASQSTIIKAWAALQQKAEQGDATAMYDFAWKYFGNKAVEPNPSRALEWLEKSASAGHLPAMIELVGIYSGEKAYHRNKDAFTANAERRAYWAGEVCRRDNVLANKRDNLLEPSYYQIYWGYYYNYLNHWERLGKIGTNTPFLPFQKLQPEKEKFLKWVNEDIKRESANGKYQSVRVSNHTLQPLLLHNDSSWKFNVVAYHFGKLPVSMEFSISKYDRKTDTVNNKLVTESTRSSLFCTFDKNDLRYGGQLNKRSCNNGRLATVFKNAGSYADYFFNLTPVGRPDMKVDRDWNKTGFFQQIDPDCNLIWVIYFYK